jgi:pilus assembly protein Flp/PilA
MEFTLLYLFGKKGGETMKMSLTEMGQGMVEYALILMLVAIVVIAAITILGPVVGNLFSSVNASL